MTVLKCLVFNGWAAGAETWALCTFPHDWIFNYVEQLDGLPEKVMAESDAVVLVGFSMGGSTALRMWLRYPEKVRGMVLISATPRMMEEKGVWKGMSERRLAALQLGTQMTFRDDPSPMYEARNMERGLEYLRMTDLRAQLLEQSRVAGSGECPMPVRIFQSEGDGIVRPANAEFLKRIFPQAEVTLVPGSEHVLPIAVPELIDAAVTDLMA